MASGNFAMRAFEHVQPTDGALTDRMTVTGTAIKTAVLGAVCAIVAILVWGIVKGGGPLALWVPLGGMAGGLVTALVISFAPKSAPVLAVPYAACQGAFLAGFSWLVAHQWLKGQTDVIFQAVGVTFAVLVAMSCAFAAGLRLGGTAMRALTVGVIGLMLYFAAVMVGNGLLGLSIPNLFTSASPLGIGFTVVCLVMASLFLVMDFQFIEEGARSGQPKYMEWVGAYALVATLVWLYIEALRLLAKLRSAE